jgi:hypothetical protein
VKAVQSIAPGSYQLFATHKPTFGLSYSGATGCATGNSGAADQSGDWTEQSVFNGGTGYAGTAFANGVPSSIALFVSGHVHQFQYLNFGQPSMPNQEFAPQLVVGTGGTLLDDDCNTGKVPAGNTDVAAFSQKHFPYIVEATGNTVTGTLSNTFSHDEFGFAFLVTHLDGNGNLDRITAQIYTISSTKAGECTIFVNPRKISCQLS